MPQLDTSTFASQIFWILVGTLMVYLFIAGVFSPKMEKVLRDREFHVDSIAKSAAQLKGEAEKIAKDSLIAIENAHIDAAADESRIISAFREQSLLEKNTLYEKLSLESKSKSDLLTKSADEAYGIVLEQLDEIVKAAMDSLSSPSPSQTTSPSPSPSPSPSQSTKRKT